MRKILLFIGSTFIALVLGVSAFAAWKLYPHHNPLPLNAPLLSSSVNEGIARLHNAEALTDYKHLSRSFQAQILASYCGVASSVSVLNSLGIETDQYKFFNDEASQIRPQLKVMFGGMTLNDLAGLLTAHGVQVLVHHASQFSLNDFRSMVESNLKTEHDYLIVNYQRAVLGQGKVGHISPLSAYDRVSDSVLIMDAAAHKYPLTWVPIKMLYAGMKTIDNSSGEMRGFVEVSKKKLKDDQS